MPNKNDVETDLLQYSLEFFAAADEALRDEVCEVRSTERRDAAVVHDGRRDASSTHGHATRYVFRTATPSRVSVGERVQCFVDGVPPLRATVAERSAAALALDVEADLGPCLPSATIARDAAWLEEALRQRLASVAERLRRGEDAGPFSVDSAFGVHQPARATPPDGFTPLPMPDALAERMADTLNEEQLHAVQSVLERPVSFVWGPPGTGKTTTVAAALAALVHHGQRVLVVTPSNAAADVLLAQLHAWLAEHPLVARGLVQRAGANLTAHLTPELRTLYAPAETLARLHDEIDAVEAWLAEERAAAATARGGDTTAWDAELAAVAAERNAIAQEVRRNCHVTVTPIANVWLRPDLWRAYDAVVADEASMLSLPALTLAAGLARARVVVAGDPQQLGPVAAANTQAARTLLRHDVFRVAGLDSAFAADDAPPYAVALRDQYRMPRGVAALVSEMWYGGGLRTAHARRTQSPLPGVAGPLVLVDTARLEPTIRRDGRTNTVHARVVAAVVQAVTAHTAGRGREDSSIGVLTLYRDQVMCLTRAQHGARRRADLTATVHRAQGSEVAVAVLDLCDAPGAAPTFLRAVRGGDEGARLLNVALSRAREAAIVVAHVPYLERAGGAVVRRLLARLREEGAVIDAAEFLSELDPGAVHRACAAGYAVAHGR